MRMKKISIGFSPCPNDTFIFHALVHGLVALEGWSLAKERLADIETLNYWALAGKLDVTKISFHALGHVLSDYVLLPAGAALGRGCGPLLVARQDPGAAKLPLQTIAIPGRYTTAAMLLHLFAPQCRQTVEMRFDQIVPAIVAGRVDAGVIIHESRFTYQEKGLVLIRDLGAWWEEVSGQPVPLGGIVAKRSLGVELIRKISAAVRASVDLAFANPARALAYIKMHAQELDDQIIAAHIGLYVNHYSADLDEAGRAAVQVFLERGREIGLLPRGPDIMLDP